VPTLRKNKTEGVKKQDLKCRNVNVVTHSLRFLTTQSLSIPLNPLGGACFKIVINQSGHNQDRHVAQLCTISLH
jgi:hypothetical protein